MARKDLELMAHLMRRAGFGATYEELEARAAKGYEETVEELLNPDTQPDMEDDLIERHYIYLSRHFGNAPTDPQSYWMYRMIASQRPLQEKMTLFWHSILCTGESKIDHPLAISRQINMFREGSLGNFRDLLLNLSKDPAMIIYLDNRYSHKDAPNENYGRELLELFSMGVGSYTEDDVKMAARAFTGWNIAPIIPFLPYERHQLEFVYNPDDHDDSEKTFLGHSGRFNGEDIVDIVARQPATAQFLARHLYNFFVADEPPVPAWPITPPRDGAAVNILADAYIQSNYDMRSVLSVLFNSDFFKDEKSWFAKIKSPAEIVVGTMRLVGDHITPKPDIEDMVIQAAYMGQEIMNPPSVEGWHAGKEWINSGSLVNRINFVADRVGDVSLPGVQSIIDRLSTENQTITPADLVDGCLELLGFVQASAETRKTLITHAEGGGDMRRDTEDQRSSFARRVGQMLQLIASVKEYQFA